MATTVEITEKDTTGHVTANYVLSVNTGTVEAASSQTTTRLDRVPVAGSKHSDTTTGSAAMSMSMSPLTFFQTKLLSVFLPSGYPHTVTADYTPYQVYDSLQAFASSIAGLLSSRAVLQSLGFDSDHSDSGSSSSSSTATYATLLSIAQSTISNLSTILFAHHASTRISAEVKYYRFLADIVNDVAFVLDCLSPSLPQVLRVPALCLSSAFRAVCGVAGGSSKAVLSAHFAKNGNIGELNAKDGSQETVVNLLGMWVGGVVVSRVDGLWATWIWLLVLLGLHLWFNYCAVRCVRLTGLNGARAGVVMSGLVQRGMCLSVDQVGRQERLFDRGGSIKAVDGTVIGKVTLGTSFADLIRYVGGKVKHASRTITADHGVVPRLITVFEKERYLLWLDISSRRVAIVLKENASTGDQLKAWCHAVRLCLAYGRITKVDNSAVLDETASTLKANNAAWQDFSGKIMAAGWDVSQSVLETGPGRRYVLQ